MIVFASIAEIPSGVRCCPEAKARTMPKATAAVPSLKRLSASISTSKRPWAFASLNVAITETGSVAAMSAPNTSALIHCHFARKCIPAAVIVAEKMTPSVASTTTTEKSRRN